MKERIFRRILAAGAALVLSAALIFFPSCTGAGSDTPGSATAAPESSRVLIRPEPKSEPEVTVMPPSPDITMSLVQFTGEDGVAEFGYADREFGIVHSLYYREEYFGRTLEGSRMFKKFDIRNITAAVGGDSDAFLGAMTAADAAGTPFDIVCMPSATAMQAVTRGLLFDINNIYKSYIDTYDPWWQRGIIEDITVGDGELYFVTGGLSYGFMRSLTGVFYNTGIIDDCYRFLENDEWTVGRLISLASEHGITADDGSMFAILTGADLPTAVKDDGGIPRACDIQNDGDRLSALIDRLLPMKRSFSVYRSYTQNRAAFAVQPIGFGADLIADPEVRYQIMPMPKYDETQTAYITPVGAGCNAFAISAKCTEPEAATLVLEALATESYRTLRKTVFEVCYRHTYGAKSDALNVFELMLDTARCDPGIFANGYSDEAASASIRALRGGSLSSYNAARHNGYWDSFATAIKKAAGEEPTGG